MEIEEEKAFDNQQLIPKELRWAIIYLKKDNVSNAEAARLLTLKYGRPLDKKAIKRIWKLYQDTGDVEPLWSKQGRPKVLSSEDRTRLITNVQEKRTLSTQKRKEELDLEVSRSTLNRVLIEEGYYAYKLRRKPILSQENVQSRLEFAKEHENWSVREWGRVVFSDESAFRLNNASGRSFVRRNENERWDEGLYEAHTGQTRSLMVWGALAMDGSGVIVRLEGTVDAESYIDTIRYRLRREFPGLYDNTLIYQHDNAPIHTARRVTTWLREKNITVMKWPSKSPDLNIMENVWSRMKYELRELTFGNLDELWEEIRFIWENIISNEFILSLYQSLPRRMAEVIRVNGLHTKY